MSELARDSDVPAVLPRVTRSTLNGDVYQTLRASILEGQLRPGSRVVEEHLASQLGVSRAPLREAIWQLKADGLIVGNGRATKIVALAQSDIHELHLMRATFETVLYQDASRLMTAEDSRRLGVLVDRMAAEPEKIPQFDLQFHELLCETSGLTRLRKVWAEQHSLFRLWLNLVAEGHDAPEVLAESHRSLLAAVVSADPVRIALETSNHIYCSGHALVAERRQWQREDAALTGDPFAIAHAAQTQARDV